MTYNGDIEEKVILNEKLITLNLNVSNNEEALRKIGETLVRGEYVKESFINAIIKRENDFPTGIQTKSIGVAIPHTDVGHVNKASIAIGILDEPVTFYSMGSDEEVKVSIIFMLAIKDLEEQLNMLQELVGIFQDEDTLSNIYHADNKLQVKDIMKTSLQG